MKVFIGRSRDETAKRPAVLISQPVPKAAPLAALPAFVGGAPRASRPSAVAPLLALAEQMVRPSAPVRAAAALALGPERKMSFFRLDDFVLERVLGTGTFGRVYLARFKPVPKYFALKRLRKLDVYRLKQIDHVQNERSLLSRLTHPFIIKMYAAMQDADHLYMLMEYAPGGELFHYLRSAGCLGVAAVRFYAAQLVLALDHLHVHDIAYRDLKPENLLLDSDGHIKLADFGFAKIVPNLTYTLCGTPEYLAPEIILGHGYGKSVDWWALGILLFEMLTGNPPFNGHTPTAIYERTLAGTVHYPPGIDAAARELLAGLLAVEVPQRLGCTERGAQAVKDAAFFAGVDWEQVLRRDAAPPIRPKGGDPAAAVNFPPYDAAAPSTMDVHIENEEFRLHASLQSYHGFVPHR